MSGGGWGDAAHMASLAQRIALTWSRRSEPVPEAVLPPARDAALDLRTLSSVPVAYRAMQIITTALGQLELHAYRGRARVEPTPSELRRPDPTLTLPDWLELIALSLLTDGNAFWRQIPIGGEHSELRVIPPAEVHVVRDERERTEYWHQGRQLTDLRHISLMRLPGQLRGMGPVESARRGLTTTSAMLDYMAGWFLDGAGRTGQPNGVLRTEQDLTAEQADAWVRQWNGLDADGNPVTRAANPAGVKVLGSGLDYRPLLLKPADAMWLEAQTFTRTEIAALFGVPAGLMLASPEGGKSMTYQNVEQEWTGFVRFTLMAYVSKLEAALSEALPRGQRVRADLEALLRADTLTRYQAHNLALTAGWMTPDEVRTREDMTPLESTDD